MHISPVDSETYLSRPGLQAPRIVCVQIQGAIFLREQGLDRLSADLDDPECVIVGHNIGYDMACAIAARPSLLYAVFREYTAGRIRCTMIREKLIRIAQGRFVASYALVPCLDRHKVAHDFHAGDKSSPDAWRLRYAELDGVPVSDWPEDATRYALADLAVGDLYTAQERYRGHGWLEDELARARASFWSYLMKCHGMRVDQRTVSVLLSRIEAELSDLRSTLGFAGLVRADGSRDTKAAVERMREACAARGMPTFVTKTGREKIKAGVITEDLARAEYVSVDADACTATGDETLIAYARYTSLTGLRKRALRLRAAGDMPIQARFDVLKDTGRFSCSIGAPKKGQPLSAFGDQVQNMNREPGPRECYIARPGYLLCSVDWSSAELHSWAQVCAWLGLGSELGRRLNAGIDPHLAFGAEMLGWTYERARAAYKGERGPEEKALAKMARQGGKAANFGFPGGLGTTTFILYAAKTYGLSLTQADAESRRDLWRAMHPEQAGYFAHINALVSSKGSTLQHFRSNRHRGGLRYCAAANSYFQGHTADMMVDAGWRLTRQCFGVDPGPLARAFMWNVVHDEFILEVPESTAHECALEIVRIMEDVGREWCPDYPVRAEPALSRRWRKGAEISRDASGRLIPWEDRELHPETVEKIRAALDTGIDPDYLGWKHGIEKERVLEICHY